MNISHTSVFQVIGSILAYITIVIATGSNDSKYCDLFAAEHLSMNVTGNLTS